MKRHAFLKLLATAGLVLLPASPRTPVAEAQHPSPQLTVSSAVEAHTAADRAVVEAFGRLPLRFEPDPGLDGSELSFVSRGRGYTISVTPAGAAMALRPSTPDGGAPAVVSWSLLGADPQASLQGLEELSGKTNYFIGNDPAAWRTDVPTY